MKEMLKTSLLWIVIICAMPVFLCAREVTALGDDKISVGISGNESAPENPLPDAAEAGDLRIFSLDSGQTLSIYGFDGDGTVRMDIEEYVYRAVLAEIPGDMEYEALKAQAAAARTYAVRRLLSGEEELAPGITAHIANDPERYQTALTDREITALYGGTEGEIPQKVRRAAAQTAGEIIVYGGSPIIAAFHTANGGLTESGENVWGKAEPYLSPVESPGDVNSEYYGAEYIFTVKEISARISAEYGGTEDFAGVNILSATPSGNAELVEVCGTEITGDRFAEIFSLPGRNFTAVSAVRDGNAAVKITVNGSGHMAGMSMCGADHMAKNGADHREILLHYYKGASLGKIEYKEADGLQ